MSSDARGLTSLAVVRPIHPLDADAPLCDGRGYIYAWMSSAVP
jgi:hypothetical protein